jgi:hypothetical protein
MGALSFRRFLLAGNLVVAALFCSTSRAADPATFVDLPTGLVIGAYADGKWLPSEPAGKAVAPGKKYRLFTVCPHFSFPLSALPQHFFLLPSYVKCPVTRHSSLCCNFLLPQGSSAR